MPVEVLLTGYAAIGAGGVARGVGERAGLDEPQPIARWATARVRRAHLVPAIRATDFVPGLRTRRLDRLSAWALLGSALALQDAALGPEAIEASRTAILCGTAFGCLDLTEEFLGAVATNASQAPPILFPETLANLPASHVARHFGISGPNLTLSAGAVSGEAALLQAVGLLRAGEADRAIVFAGDVLTRALFEWYEAARLLAPACTGEPPSLASAGRRRIVPGEGLAACVLETAPAAAARQARAHARYHAGWLGPLPEGATRESETLAVLQGLRGEARIEDLALVAAGGCGPSWLAGLADATARRDGPGLQRHAGLEFGEHGGSGLLQLGVALALWPAARHRFALLAGPADRRLQASALLWARPEPS